MPQDPWLRTDPWLHYAGAARTPTSPCAGDASTRMSCFPGQGSGAGPATQPEGPGATSSGMPGSPPHAVGNFATTSTPVAAPWMSPNLTPQSAQMTGHPGLFSQPCSFYPTPQGNQSGMHSGGTPSPPSRGFGNLAPPAPSNGACASAPGPCSAASWCQQLDASALPPPPPPRRCRAPLKCLANRCNQCLRVLQILRRSCSRPSLLPSQVIARVCQAGTVMFRPSDHGFAS